MEPREPYWQGVVEMEGGVYPIEIYNDTEFVDVYINGDYRDDITDKEDLYGKFYRDLGSYRAFYYSPLSVDDVWPS